MFNLLPPRLFSLFIAQTSLKFCGPPDRWSFAQIGPPQSPYVVSNDMKTKIANTEKNEDCEKSINAL